MSTQKPARNSEDFSFYDKLGIAFMVGLALAGGFAGTFAGPELTTHILDTAPKGMWKLAAGITVPVSGICGPLGAVLAPVFGCTTVSAVYKTTYNFYKKPLGYNPLTPG